MEDPTGPERSPVGISSCRKLLACSQVLQRKPFLNQLRPLLEFAEEAHEIMVCGADSQVYFKKTNHLALLYIEVHLASITNNSFLCLDFLYSFHLRALSGGVDFKF